MTAIEKLFELYVTGDLMDAPVNTPELLDISRRLDQYIADHTAGAAASELNTLVADYAYRNLEHGFIQGFRCARAILLDSRIEG